MNIQLFVSTASYRTSGANEIIFIYPFGRNSLATGPKMRLPIGSPEFASNTAELSSNRTIVSSVRRISLTVLTTTALRTSPFLTFAFGIASLTVTTMTSPTEAYRRLVPPKTLMQRTFLAPELSATLSTVSVCIISSPTAENFTSTQTSRLGLSYQKPQIIRPSR